MVPLLPPQLEDPRHHLRHAPGIPRDCTLIRAHAAGRRRAEEESGMAGKETETRATAPGASRCARARHSPPGRPSARAPVRGHAGHVRPGAAGACIWVRVGAWVGGGSGARQEVWVVDNLPKGVDPHQRVFISLRRFACFLAGSPPGSVRGRAHGGPRGIRCRRGGKFGANPGKVRGGTGRASKMAWTSLLAR